MIISILSADINYGLGKKNGLLKPEEIELTIGDIYNDEQLYEINLQGYQDKVNVLTKEVQALKEKRTMDMATQMMIARKTGELTNAKNLLQEFGNNEDKNYMLTMTSRKKICLSACLMTLKLKKSCKHTRKELKLTKLLLTLWA